MVLKENWKEWYEEGTIHEFRAAGLTRTVIFNPYPEVQSHGLVDADFRILLENPKGKQFAEYRVHLHADNRDIVYIEDWSQVIQKKEIVLNRRTEPEERKWSFETNLNDSTGSTFGNQLFVQSLPDISLTALTYPLNLKGYYAIFIQGKGPIDFRLTGDEESYRLGSKRPGQERLWKWGRMDRQHLVLEQAYDYTGSQSGTIDYVKLIPLTDEKVKELESVYEGKKDKLLAFYWEPYSWAFHYGCWQPLDHRKAMKGYQIGEVDLLDTQVGRFGMKSVYESRIVDQLLLDTHGDPIGTTKQPTTNNVGMMQQYTNTLDASIRYGREFGIPVFANFGLSNCYKNTNLQGQFSIDHPEWMRGNRLRFEVPEVRQFAFDAFEECLEIGVDHISVDLCRYPDAIDVPETCNAFLRDLRKLADQWEQERGSKINIMLRFPVLPDKQGHLFDFATWIRECWVDYLIPSALAERFYNFDLRPYLKAAQATNCKVIPRIGYSLNYPGLVLFRLRQMYEQGADGMYSYRSLTLSDPEILRLMPVFSRTEAIERWWQRDQAQRTHCSKGIYIAPLVGWFKYWKQQRIRVWLEGIPQRTVEMYLDGKIVSKCDGPPYTLGTEGYESDSLITPGKHTLLIRARDGDGWLEQTFQIPDVGERGEWNY
ncbi:MAG TPA: hypothetical protein DD458_00095 [Prolixibacteraceae bacterium]|nr:hypothetical protein [Prolixibacteraceae bacterium]HCU63865.1 hypothetical protein [Prolixibacteraceae bacterium]